MNPIIAKKDESLRYCIKNETLACFINTHSKLTKLFGCLKNQTTNVKMEVPFLQCEVLKTLERRWWTQNNQYKTLAKSIWTLKEQTIRGDENCIFFVWGISETTSRIPVLPWSYCSKGCGKIQDTLKNLCLSGTRFGNYTRKQRTCRTLCHLLRRNLEETLRKAATFFVFIFAWKETKF